MITTLLICTMLAAAGAENTLPNPSFEDVADGKPAGWNTHLWGGDAVFEVAGIGHSGAHSVMMRSESGADATWGLEVPVKPFSVYRLSGWIKTENVAATTGEGALLNLHTMPYKTRALTGTHDWTRVELTFETGEQDSVLFHCLLGGWGLATGTAWYDDVSIELIEEGGPEVTVTIDAAKTGAPISKYIYGQFIEHLGRCIYGGIWAELLEDRKFFYAVNAEESPWREHVTGSGRVEMTTEYPYAGEQHVRLIPGDGDAGIVQTGVPLARGRAYEGRIVMAATEGITGVRLALAWGTEREQAAYIDFQDLSPEFKAYDFAFTAGGDANPGIFHVGARGVGHVDVATASLMPADNVQGMRADTLKLLQELNAPVYRWPGGNFVSGYDWKDGIGPRDRRPPRKNPAWKGIEHNDFGLDEFIVFCETIGAEPLLVVNSGAGSLEMALAELEYANGAASTPMGALRAENGHPDPYNVRWWGIGNEMYGNWQIGHMPLEDYVQKHKQFAEAMRAQDPSIKVIAVGATGEWSETMLTHCADHMDLLSEHFYCGEKPGVSAHMNQLVQAIRSKADQHRAYHANLPALQGKRIPIAMDEWNYWYGEELYGEIGVRYFLKDALGVAAGIHEFARNSDVIFMANYAQTVNVIGCIKTTGTHAAWDATGLPLLLYRREFGSIPIAVEGGRPIDVMAAWVPDRTALTIGVVNPLPEAVDVPFTLTNAAITGDGVVWTIAGTDPMLYNVPGEPPRLEIVESPVTGLAATLPVPGYSICLFRLPVK